MTVKILILLFICGVMKNTPVSGQGCMPRDFGHSSTVCVCNSTYCDTIEEVEATDSGLVQIISDRNGKRHEKADLSWSGGDETVGVEISTNKDIKYQKIIGFGGAFTDAAGINIAKLSDAAQEHLISSYFSPSGLEYNIGRVNIGGCDFSDRPYTYCDTPGLENFALTEDDTVYKIPYINMAKNMSRNQINMFASPWSAPAWMKSNGALNGEGYLLEENYQTWADYFILFLDAYRNYGIEFWGLTAQNEPYDGTFPDFSFNAMGWNASTQTKFIAENLGPSLQNNGYGDILLMALDDQRPFLLAWAETIMENPDAAKYVAGWALHWYVDFLGLADNQDEAAGLYPDKFIFHSEACTGSYPWDLQKVILGSWERGQEYANNIIENLNHFSSGWTDWNIALDKSGGPNWANNFVDSPIIVDPENDEFYKNPMFYVMGHFSKYIPRESVRIENSANGYDSDRIQFVTLERPDGSQVLVVTNRHLTGTVQLRIVSDDRRSEIIQVEPESIHTIIWK